MSKSKKTKELSGRPIRVSTRANSRMVRLVRALLRGPVTREDADRIAGCSNSPDLIADIRHLGLGHMHLVCTLFPVIDRDGKVRRPGRYSLTPEGHAMLTEWLNLPCPGAC
jgi:hypothetical protein